MIIKIHYKITLDITQIIDKHIQICSQDCVLIYIYIYIYIVTLGITLNNVTPPNNLLFNSYFENLTVKLNVLYVLNMHANWM